MAARRLRRPAPGLIAIEPPWLAMTLLPGALLLDAEAPDALARTLLAIHAIDPARRPRDFYDWAYPDPPPRARVGPADLDVAHCRTALALLHGRGAADRFRSAYVSSLRASPSRSW